MLERILRQPMDTSASIEREETNIFLAVIPVILNTYVKDVSKIHEKLLKSIPQQAVLFYNNCMFLAHWVAKNVEADIPTNTALVKTLKDTGDRSFKAQVIHQNQILMQILKEFGKIQFFNSIFAKQFFFLKNVIYTCFEYFL